MSDAVFLRIPFPRTLIYIVLKYKIRKRTDEFFSFLMWSNFFIASHEMPSPLPFRRPGAIGTSEGLAVIFSFIYSSKNTKVYDSSAFLEQLQFYLINMIQKKRRSLTFEELTNLCERHKILKNDWEVNYKAVYNLKLHIRHVCKA